ncbi:DUF1330 domain-containing protein [Marinomonas sp. C2222]|uniref:DUF1330 domain-containing protein n=1 Tax=Marinomonas sargassi TaxID=2984494 RepID=A0ABT2YTM8_9GAMM|nr:DUF1330 domain-containing protein [Marinomonas sargassi]MCV2403254.1 DUF1330 domain-containing protein [Marinomonas sargassi]
MAYQRIMGLEVIDQGIYQKYREAMMPILATFGGEFTFDFTVSEVLLSQSTDNINRLFTITFPSKQHMEGFFSNPDYLAVKAKYFDLSVKSATVISLHEVSAE